MSLLITTSITLVIAYINSIQYLDFVYQQIQVVRRTMTFCVNFPIARQRCYQRKLLETLTLNTYCIEFFLIIWQTTLESRI